MKKISKGTDNGMSRRAFLGTGAAAGATLLTKGTNVAAQDAQSSGAVENQIAQLTPEQIQRDVGTARPPVPARDAQRPGSDLMVQVLKDLGMEYVAGNPGSSFEGLQESIINYGDKPNTMPEFITAMHEESSVDMANGYVRSTGKPMAAILHGTVGITHAAMAIYTAYQKQNPVVLLVGRDETFFLQGHTANDLGAIARAYTKWDAQPKTLAESLTAIQEAYNQAITPPCGPTLVVIDTELQKEEAGDLQVPTYVPPKMPTISNSQAKQIAKGLVDADNPRINVGHLLTPEGVKYVVELAELVGASVETSATKGPMSFPQRHPQCGPGADTNYDYTLGLETAGVQGSIIGPHRRTVEGRDLCNIGLGGVRVNAPSRGEAMQGPAGAPASVAAVTGGPGQSNDMIADAEASLPVIITEARRLLTKSSNKRRTIQVRKSKHGEANQEAFMQALRKALEGKRSGWDGSPVSTARVYSELWPLIKDEDWCLASPTIFSGSHHADLWDHNKSYSYLGWHGPAAGIGFGIGCCTGAALAARERGRFVVNIQCDGDLNFTPGSLWTAAHHRLPLLTIMHNNRAWNQELMFIAYMCGVRGRGTDRSHIGTTIRDPHINYAKMAQAYGIESEGPISDPSLLAAAFKRGVDTVKQGRPYLIDVLTQPR